MNMCYFLKEGMDRHKDWYACTTGFDYVRIIRFCLGFYGRKTYAIPLLTLMNLGEVSPGLLHTTFIIITCTSIFSMHNSSHVFPILSLTIHLKDKILKTVKFCPEFHLINRWKCVWTTTIPTLTDQSIITLCKSLSYAIEICWFLDYSMKRSLHVCAIFTK